MKTDGRRGAERRNAPGTEHKREAYKSTDPEMTRAGSGGVTKSRTPSKGRRVLIKITAKDTPIEEPPRAEDAAVPAEALRAVAEIRAVLSAFAGKQNH